MGFKYSLKLLKPHFLQFVQVRPQLDGYLHENGTIDLARFGTYLDILSRCVVLAKFDPGKIRKIVKVSA